MQKTLNGSGSIPRIVTVSKMISILVAGLLALIPAVALQASSDSPASGNGSEASGRVGVPDSGQLEKELQNLSWEQFRSVVHAIPKLKADVDAYGALGWQYVRNNYQTYGWKRNIEKLKAPEKRRLARLISETRKGIDPAR